jgi:hypothetical protein
MNRAIGFSQPIIPNPCHFPRYRIEPKEKAQGIRQKWDPIAKRLVDCPIIPPPIPVPVPSQYIVFDGGNTTIPQSSARIFDNVYFDIPRNVVQVQIIGITNISLVRSFEAGIPIDGSGTTCVIDGIDIDAGNIIAGGGLFYITILPPVLTSSSVITLTFPEPISELDYFRINV